MFFVTNGVVIRDFGVLRRAIDAESRDLAIWTTPEAQNLKFDFFDWVLLISRVWGSKAPYFTV